MESLSQLQPEPRLGRGVLARLQIRERFRRAVGRGARPSSRSDARPSSRSRTLAQRFAPIKRVVEDLLRLGGSTALPTLTNRHIRLCNILALGGGVIMAIWAVV